MNKVFVFIKQETKIDKILLILGFTLFMALAAHIHIFLPFTPVPVTLQTFACLLTGAFLGASAGFTSQLLYLLFGFLGLPFFTYNSLFCPTAGYLLGFVFASLFVGLILKGEKASFIKTLFAMFLGEVILYSLGIIWLSLFLHISFFKAISLGLLLFIPVEIIKLFSAVSVYFVYVKKIRNS